MTNEFALPDQMGSVIDRVAIADVLARIVHSGDDGDLDTYATLIADDVTWSMPGVVHTGRAAVLDGLRARHDSGLSGPRSGTRHVLTTTMVDVAGDRATARSTWLLVGAEDGGTPALRRFGTYHDEFVRRGDRWLLANRRITFGTN